VFKKWKWKQEVVVVLCMDTSNVVIGKPIIASVGTANQAAVHPRDIFREAITRNACGILLAHCHPSEDMTPSSHDYNLTERIKKAGELLNILLLDHVIVTQKGYTSLSELGKL